MQGSEYEPKQDPENDSELEDLPPVSAAELPKEHVKRGAWKIMPRDQGKGVRIIATSLADDSVAASRLIGFSRELTREGRAIVVDLEPHSTKLAALMGDRPHSSLGITDLVDGKASFGEVIHRDQASRLHFVFFGMARAFKPEEFDLVLDALSQTYDFLLIAAPSSKSSGLARDLAAHADLVVLAAPAKFIEADLANASEQLYAAGATEVVVLDGEFEEAMRVVA